jgi:hypothetical protein
MNSTRPVAEVDIRALRSASSLEKAEFIYKHAELFKRPSGILKSAFEDNADALEQLEKSMNVENIKFHIENDTTYLFMYIITQICMELFITDYLHVNQGKNYARNGRIYESRGM